MMLTQSLNYTLAAGAVSCFPENVYDLDWYIDYNAVYETILAKQVPGTLPIKIP